MYVVDVVEIKTGKVVETIGPVQSERAAEKVERGLLINMNREQFVTVVRKMKR